MTSPYDISPSSMRAVLGHFATGLAVITAAGPDGPIGFTCQSLTSLSLDPALVSFNPSRNSASWPAIRSVGRFAVNILPAGAEALALRFSRKGVDRFHGVEWRLSAQGSPHLQAAAAWVDCELHTEYDGGDHTIAVGRVNGLATAESGTDPLLFVHGKFAALRQGEWQALSA
ncbi:MAG: flavin reductase family protein [Renibacterium sp.]|nr:flavin reductase family protein [Renibacterium sp.]